MSDEMKLKACAHCGGQGEYGTVDEGDDNGGHFIMCSNRQCGMSTKLYFPLMEPVDEMLAEDWNRRSPDLSLLREAFEAGRLSDPDMDQEWEFEDWLKDKGLAK